MKTDLANDPVSRYVLDLQQRYPEFRREHLQELRQIGADPFTRVYQQYFLFRSRTDFESQLHSILTPEERDKLQVDPVFTQAWHIFVDMCWLRKRMTTAGILAGVVLFVLALAVFAVWAMPYVAGPKPR